MWLWWKFAFVHFCFPKQCVHIEGFLRSVLRLRQGMLSGLRLFHCKFSHKSSLLRCPCAFRLRRLAKKCGYRFCLFRWCHFTSAPCSFFEQCPFHAAARAMRFGNSLRYFEVQHIVVFRDKCRTSGIFNPRGRRGTFWTLLPSLRFVRLRSPLSLWHGARFSRFSEILVKRFTNSLEGPSLVILQKFHGAVLEVAK